MKRLLPAITALLASTAIASAEGELQLFNWGDYTSPELLAKFEAETGIKVTVTDYDSNDTALAKIEAGGGGYDLVVPSANYVPIYVEKGLIQPVYVLTERQNRLSYTLSVPDFQAVPHAETQHR